MRIFKTGTGRGKVIGTADISFYATEQRAIDGCSVTWEGSDWLPTLLPAIAWDEYLPSLRLVPVEGGELRGNAAQQHELRQQEAWVAKAIDALKHGNAVPVHGLVPVVESPKGSMAATAKLTVRINEGDQRLWSETTYDVKDPDGVLFGLIHRVLWDWVVANDPDGSGVVELVSMYLRQFAYFSDHRIPADFRLREIGLAPFAAWTAEVEEAVEQEIREAAERLGWKPEGNEGT
jgi:hypothetical protein